MNYVFGQTIMEDAQSELDRVFREKHTLLKNQECTA